MSESRKTLLCIDDHKSSVAGWCLYLQGAGYAVETAHSAQEGLQLFATQAIDLVLLDYAMPEVDGGEVAATMKRMKPQVRIILFTGVAEVPPQARAQVDAFVQKGQQPSLVLQAIDELLGAGERAA
jgi:CheY-like chemotaxis protein